METNSKMKLVSAAVSGTERHLFINGKQQKLRSAR